jgi:hypothetical protein
MREKMVKLAKQAGKLLMIELFVPGGTLVVLAILLMQGHRLAASTKGADHREYALETY